jgi:hypothetical protein
MVQWFCPFPALGLPGSILSVYNLYRLAVSGDPPKKRSLPHCPGLLGSPTGPPSLPESPGRTLLEAEMGHPLDGRVSLLHELVEADQEGLLLLPLPACLRGVLGKEQEVWGWGVGS